MINSKKIESEDEDDKFFKHEVLPTNDNSSQKKNNSNQTYPSMPPQMQNQMQNQNQYTPPQQNHNNIQFQKPNYNYNPQGYNPGQYNQMPQNNRPPNFSAPFGQNMQDQPLTPNMYNSFGIHQNIRYSQPQQPNFQADLSLHDFNNRKHSMPQNNNQFNNRPF